MSNSCMCACRGGKVASSTTCSTTPPPCTGLWCGRKSCATMRCRRGSRCVNTILGPSCRASKPKQCACPKILRPVCCVDKSGKKTTKANSCLCTCGVNGGKVDSPSKCPTKPTCTGPWCYRPVCCVGKHGKSTKKSIRACTIEGGKVTSRGSCGRKSCATMRCKGGNRCVNTFLGPRCKISKRKQCACPKILRQVCCMDKRGKKATKSNSCLCTCGANGGKVAAQGRCPATPSCRCPRLYRPVCCLGKDGMKFTKINSCACQCSGGNVLTPGKCSRRKALYRGRSAE